MYKVLIADDENLIRITLKNMIDWQALDCEVIALAKDGEEAFQIYEAAHPEIVITDLKMPKMDGIELITKIRSENTNTQVIALSNYSDFELVRDAMKAGAFDYLLKVTLEEKDLIEIIRQVKEHCEANSLSLSKEDDTALMRLRQCMILRKNEQLEEPEEFQLALQEPMFAPYQENYQLVYFRIDNVYSLYESKIKDHSVLKRNLQDIIRETIPFSIDHLMIFLSNHSGILMFHHIEKIRVLNICNSMIRNLNQYMNISVSISVSPKEKSIQTFYETYEHLLEVHENRFYEGEGTLLSSEESILFEELNMNEVDYHTRLIHAVAEKDFDMVNTIKNEALSHLKLNRVSPYQLKEYFIFILNNIEGNEIIKGLKEVYPFESFHKQIRACETYDCLKKVLDETFEEMCKWLWDTNSDKYKKNIMEIIAFIEENLHQKVTLKMIADHFDMNESYLSRTFKSETGRNLITFINDQKMGIAKQLLEDETYRIRDVAQHVGINDQFYFNKVFKKTYGISPSEYRKKLHV